jgi:glutaredoxin 3
MKMSRKYVCDGDACTLVDDGSGLDKLPAPDPSIRWIIYGTDWCSYCNKAKELLDSRKQEYLYINVSNYSNGRSSLVTITNGYRTVPVIYHNGKFIGGYTDLCALKSNDK